MAGIVCADCLKTSLIDNVKGRCAICYSRYLRSTKRIKALSCEVCRCRFQSARRDARFCSDACRQWSYRERRLLRMGSKVMTSERKRCAVAFLKAAIAYYASLGVRVERVMTDNGACYKSFAFQKACKRLGLAHIRHKH